MKTLIQKTIRIVGISPSELNIFTITEDSQKQKPGYKKCLGAAGRNLHVQFRYEEDSEEKSGSVRVAFPETTDELDIKNSAITAINDFLNS